jgi:putative polyketide hydroxylase
MEIFDAVGIADQIPQVEKSFKLRRVKVESMTGKWHEEPMPWKPEGKVVSNSAEEPQQYTPFMGAALAQDRLGMFNLKYVLRKRCHLEQNANAALEPILREKAKSLGADIRMGTRMTGFQQDENSVRISATTHNGDEYEITTPYMIAADGHRSNVRETLGIETTGRGYLNTVRSVLFRAHLNEYMKGYQQFAIRQPRLEAFLTTYGDDRWVLMFTDDVERTEDEQKAAIRKAVGIEDLDFEIITTGRWELKANIASTFQAGRVFLAGDAAHTLPPTRGG